MIEITVAGALQLKSVGTNVVKSLVVNYVTFVSVLDQLVEGEGGVVRLYDGLGDLVG